MLQQYKMVHQGEINMALSAENTYDFQKDPKSENTAANYWVDNTNMELKSRVKPNTKITISNPDTTAIVIQPFTITFEPSETGGYIATSDISYTFEVETTPSQARESYLKSLLEDIVWFQERYSNQEFAHGLDDSSRLQNTTTHSLTIPKGSHPFSLLEELQLLQCYIQIVK
jgi:hypothetical protein